MKRVQDKYGAMTTLECSGRLLWSAGFDYGDRISPSAPGELSFGHDDADDFRGNPLTAAERREIADHMIARWQAWATAEADRDGER